MDILTAPLATGIKALLQQKADLLAFARQNLTAREEGWEGRDDQATAKLETITAAITREERLADAERSLLPTTPTQPGSAVASVHDRSEDDPKRGFRSSRDFCLAVMQTYRFGRMDPRLKPLQATAGSDEQSGTSDPYGGFMMPIAFSPNILSVQGEADPTAGLTRPLPMDAPMVKINARVDKNHATSVSGGLRVYRHSETTDVDPARMQFEQLSFDAHELIGAAFATESVLTDSPGAFIALISEGFRDEFGAKNLNEKLNGTGVGQFLGIMNSPCKIAVAKETGQKAATIMVENIDNMAARCWRYREAVWLANATTRPQLRGLSRAVGTGGSPVAYFTVAPDGRELLDGRPIHFTEFAEVLGTEGDLVLGNWREFIEGTYQPLQQAESIHVRFLNHERTFKFWLRNAGMPWWRSALTPRKGSTLSPFVTLATRS